MSDRSPDIQDTPSEASSNDAIDHSRRKLAGAALGISAVFTLASRPVLAGQCMSPSAACSGNLSQHGTPPSCLGVTPGYWKTHTGWPSPYTQGSCTSSCSKCQSWSNGTLFHPLFGGTKFMVDQDNNPNTPKTSLTLQQVMVMNNADYPGVTDPDNIGAHIVAALLNARSGKTPSSILSETSVIGMWNEWVTKGYFEPTAGVQWNSAQIVTYLKTTMPL
jgi:hypothetical protein